MANGISETEYDSLSPETQKKYIWCPICNRFYLKGHNSHAHMG